MFPAEAPHSPEPGHSHKAIDGTQNDIGLWPDHTTDEQIEYWLTLGDCQLLQNCSEAEFDEFSKRQMTGSDIRMCTTALFVIKTSSGMRLRRKWVCFSSSQGTVFCYICKLMNPSTENQFVKGGFCSWSSQSQRLKEHEKSIDHLKAAEKLALRACKESRVDIQHAEQAEEMISYYTKLLNRLIDVTILIIERNLAFRGSDEIIGSHHNGNYLGIIELLAKYDPFLTQHIAAHANKGKGHPNYLGHNICEEFIEIMAEQVSMEIVRRIKESKHYSISIDSTPDITHVDQLCVVFRYMEGSKKIERFLTFLSNVGKKGDEVFEELKAFLASQGIKLSDCRGQSYDNGSNMAGKYSGVQARLTAENPQALFCPCCAHSLNLVGVHCAESCSEAIRYFAMLQEVYNFFTGSTSRYEILQQRMDEIDSQTYTPKSLSGTRWAARAECTKSMEAGQPAYVAAAEDIIQSADTKATVRSEAEGILSTLGSLEFCIYVYFWNDVLSCFNMTSLQLQSSNMDLNSAVASLSALKLLMHTKRECFDEYERKAMAMCGHCHYKETERRRRAPSIRLQDDPQSVSKNVTLQQPDHETARQNFKTSSFDSVLDTIDIELERRFQAYTHLSTKFGFLRKIHSLTPEQLRQAASQLADLYSDDLTHELSDELIHFAEYSKAFPFDPKNKEYDCFEDFLYSIIITGHLETSYPNVLVALRIYLVQMVANCSGERSFSVMGLVYTKLRSSMRQTRMSNLVMMSMNHDVLRELDFTKVKKDFVNRKIRKKLFQ